MMPIIQPLPTQCDQPTEYKKEREIFAKMQADLHWRNRLARRLSLLLHDVKNRTQGRRQFRPMTARETGPACLDRAPV